MNELLPEEEPLDFSHQQKVLRPKKYKTKLTAKRKWNIKRKLIKLTIVLIVLVTALTYGAYKTNEFFKTHELQFRSPIQMPVQIVPRGHETAIIETAQASEINFDGADFIHKDGESPKVVSTNTNEKVQISDIVAKVYRLESSGGKNDSCRAKGQYNGYGFIPGTCYKTHAEVEQLVTKWFNKRLDTLGLQTALCYYNTGYKLDTCEYYKNYLAL